MKRRPFHYRTALVAVLALSTLIACSTSISDRELEREKAKAAAALKRVELEKVVGDFVGELKMEEGTQTSSLHLEIKEVPQTIDGQIDPILVPVLTGYLRFIFGSDPTSNEFIGFGVVKSDYDAKRQKLDLVVENTDSKQILLALAQEGEGLKGSYAAPSISASGTAWFNKGSATPGPAVGGEYHGFLERKRDGLYHRAELSIATSVQPPEGLKVSGTLRIRPGEGDETEFTTHRYDVVSFNPVSGALVFRSEGTEVVMSATWKNGRLSGTWATGSTGTMGALTMSRVVNSPAPEETRPFASLRGTYRGKLTNNVPQANLPERIEITFNTAQDATAPGGLRVSGGVRLFLGGFESNEFVEQRFEDAQYNFFTRQFSSRTAVAPRLVLKGTVDEAGLKATVSADGIAEAASVEAEKR